MEITRVMREDWRQVLLQLKAEVESIKRSESPASPDLTQEARDLLLAQYQGWILAREKLLEDTVDLE